MLLQNRGLISNVIAGAHNYEWNNSFWVWFETDFVAEVEIVILLKASVGAPDSYGQANGEKNNLKIVRNEENTSFDNFHG